MKIARISAVIGAVSALTLTMSSCARVSEASGDTYTIKFSHVTPPGSPKGQAAEEFKRVVEEESDGKIKVEIYPNSELYGDEDELQALQKNSVQMLAPSGAKLSAIAPQLQVLDLPYVVESPEDIPEVFGPDTSIGKAVYENKTLADKGVKVLGMLDNGIKHVSSNRQMTSPKDLQNLRFRIQPSEVIKDQIEAWGGSGTPMSFSEVYTSLQTGVIDAQENTYASIEEQKMHTVQKHITETHHGYVGYIMVINEDFYESLPQELQEDVDAASEAASDLNREVAAKYNAEAKQKILEAGTTEITTLTPDQHKAFKDAVVPEVWQNHADVIGQALIDELIARTK